MGEWWGVLRLRPVAEVRCVSNAASAFCGVALQGGAGGENSTRRDVWVCAEELVPELEKKKQPGKGGVPLTPSPHCWMPMGATCPPPRAGAPALCAGPALLHLPRRHGAHAYAAVRAQRLVWAVAAAGGHQRGVCVHRYVAPWAVGIVPMQGCVLPPESRGLMQSVLHACCAVSVQRRWSRL